LHTSIWPGNEWFAPGGVNTSTIDYDLGDNYDILRLALWNEEHSGISRMSVYTSNDAAFGVATLVGVFGVTDNPFGADYAAEVFSLAPTNARYVRVQAFGPNVPFDFDAVSMGEIAFDVVPEPSTFALLGLGLGLVGVAGRRRRARS
jgi:hypothetical protein